MPPQEAAEHIQPRALARGHRLAVEIATDVAFEHAHAS
jgi:hypothetical protein